MSDEAGERKSKAIADHWAKVVDTAHDAIAGKLDARKKAVLTETLERVETDIAPHLAPLIEHLLNDPNVPESVRGLLGELANPQHFTSSLLIGIAVGGIISPMLGAVVAPIVDTIADEAWTRSPGMELSPAEIALGMLRHNPHIGDPYAEAATSGINHSRLDALVYNTGHGLAIEELLLLYRRGQISQARLEEGLRQSAVRDEWFGELLDLRYAPPGAGTVITGALKGWLTPGEAQKKLGESGIDPANYDWLFHSSGRPPGIMSMIGLWNRGLTTQAKVEQAVRQSDINVDYMAEVLNLRHYHLPPRSVIPMLRSGALTEAEARDRLTKHGVDPADITAFIKEGTQHASSSLKELSASAIARAYELKLIAKGDASARLTALKYNPADAEILLDIADAAAAHSLLAAATTRIHTLYVRQRITRAVASADLAKAGQPPAAVTQLLALWDEEITTDVAYPTASQWVGAYRREVITLSRCITEVKKAGYVGWSVKVIIADGFPPGHLPDAVAALDPDTL